MLGDCGAYRCWPFAVASVCVCSESGEGVLVLAAALCIGSDGSGSVVMSAVCMCILLAVSELLVLV